MPDVSNHTIVVPNGTIILYDDVPLDSEYTHSINRYATNTELVNTLNTYPHHTLYNQSYSRLTENSVRVGLSKEELLHCNYIAIRNGAYYASGETNILTQGENKIYYGFVTEVEYVNNQTSDVFFTIDYLQTYWNNFTIPANFIEREHCIANDDKIGNNLIDEHLGTGDLFINAIHKHTYEMNRNTRWWIVIAYLPNYNADVSGTKFIVNRENRATEITQDNSVPIELIHPQRTFNFASPICFVTFRIGFSFMDSLIYDIQKCVALINENGGNVVDMVLIPDEIHTQIFVNESINPINKTVTFSNSFQYQSKSGSYTPRNKKVYQSPFTSIVVTNNNGATAEYKRELFNVQNGTGIFQILTTMNPDFSMYIYPTAYRGTGYDYENGVSYQDFPKASWSEDSFTKWWQQNKTNFGISLATGIISTALTVGTAASAGATLAGQIANRGTEDLANFATANQMGLFYTAGKYKRSALNNFEREQNVRAGARRNMAISGAMGAGGIARTLGELSSAKNTPDNVKAQNNLPIQNAVQNRMGFSIYDMCISGEIAEMIDNYFDMYGYATNKVKVPNFISANRRPIWNYIKMQNAFIKSQTGDRGLPETAQTTIQCVFNNGITLWNNIAQIGNYNLANSNR